MHGSQADAAASPRHVLVVGASGQLGSALCEDLAGRGCNLALCGNDAIALVAQAERLRQAHQIHVSSDFADVRDLAGLRTVFQRHDRAQPLDWVIVNAGLGSTCSPGDVMETEADAAALIDVNFVGALNAVRAAVEILRPRRRGRVVVVASMSALAGSPENPVYAASKAAIRIACLSMRPALNKDGIGLTVACPGFLTGRATGGGATWRPFAVAPEAAARLVIEAALKARAQTLFPWRMASLVRVMMALPIRWREAIYQRWAGT